MDKQVIQEREYVFPYHHLPELDGHQVVRPGRTLFWCLDWANYMFKVMEYLQRYQPRSLLDVGCGDGRLFTLVEHIPVLVGVDVSARALAFASAFNPGAVFVHGTVDDVEGTFDAITLIEVIEHIPDDGIPHLVQSLDRRLKEQGVVIVSVPTINSPLSPKHYRHYTLPLLVSHMAPLKLVEYSFVSAKGWQAWLLRHMLANRLYTLNHEGLVALISRLSRRWTYRGSEKTGLHLVATFRKKD
ncbi:MAG: class I SAM-dependent methyltransferase [Bacillota bacterium]